MALNFLVNNNFLFNPVGPVIPLIANPTYEPRAIFSINASNQLQGTFWMTKDGQQMTSSLGTLSFVIRDKNGVTIGITESGIAADVNGFYYMSPVLADAIQDLTHYTVEITVTADSHVRKGVVAITLGE
jgi:hypothetical protein